MRELRILCLVLVSIVCELPSVGLGADAQLAESLFQKGLTALHNRDFALADSSLQKAAIQFRQLSHQDKETKVLIHLGELSIQIAEYEKARKYFLKANDICSSHNLPEQTAITYKKLGVIDFYEGAFISAREYFQKAYSLYDNVGNNEGKANILNNLGLVALQTAKNKTGNFQIADDYFHHALKIQKTYDLESGMAKVYNNLGALADVRHKFADSQRYYEQVITYAQRLNLPKVEADARNNFAIVSRKLGHFGRSQDNLQKSLTIYDKYKLPHEKANTLVNLGNIKSDLGEFEQAKKLYLEALEIYRRIKLTQKEADVLINLGTLYRYFGDPYNAIDIYQNAIAIYRNGKRDRKALEALLLLGHTYGEIGNIKDARQAYKVVMNQSSGLVEEDAVMMEALANLGDVATSKKDLNDFVISYNQIAAKLGIPISRELLVFMNQGKEFLTNQDKKEVKSSRQCFPALGRFHLLTGEYEKAKDCFSVGVEYGDQTNDAGLMIGCQIGLGAIGTELGNFSDAKQIYLEAINQLESLRKSIPQGQRALFFRSKIGGFSRLYPYEQMVTICNLLGQNKEAFFYSEHTKARSLLEALAVQGSNDYGIPPHFRKREVEITNKIAALNKLEQEAFRSNNRLVQEKHKQERIKQESQLDQLIGTMRAEYPQYVSMAYPHPLEAENIALRNDEVLVEYEVTDKKLWIFLLKKGQEIKTIEVPVGRAELEQLIQQYLEPFKVIPDATPEILGDIMRDYDPILGHKLYAVLLKDVLKQIDKHEQILIIPDEILCLLPFGTLVVKIHSNTFRWKKTGRQGPYPVGIHFVGEDRAFCYWQSATALTMSRLTKKHNAREQILVVADPIFNKKDDRIGSLTTNMKKEQSQTILVTRRRISPKKAESLKWDHNREDEQKRWQLFNRLESTTIFANKLQKKYPGKVKTLLGKEASESLLMAENLGMYGQILFATHGIVDDSKHKVTQATIVLSNPSLTGEKTEDGFLTMAEIMNLKMNAELVATLACETGVGSLIGGEGVMNLGRAFQYAGAQSVLVSLWSVADSSTNLLAEEMVDNLRHNKSRTHSLFMARKVLREAGYRHPFYWGPFILIGEP